MIAKSPKGEGGRRRDDIRLARAPAPRTSRDGEGFYEKSGNGCPLDGPPHASGTMTRQADSGPGRPGTGSPTGRWSLRLGRRPALDVERRNALLVAGSFMLIGVVWVLLSDPATLRALGGFLAKPEAGELNRLQSLKDVGFMLVAGVVLYLVVLRLQASARSAADAGSPPPAPARSSPGDTRVIPPIRTPVTADAGGGGAARPDGGRDTRGPGEAGAAGAPDERGRLAEQLERSRRMEAVGRLAGGVTHDVNNVLTAIAGHAELALRQLPSDAPARVEIEGVRRAVTRAARLTRQLLAFSRRQVVQPRLLDLNAVLLDLAPLLDRLLGDDLKLRIVPGAGRGTIRADLAQVEQLVLNLCLNARDAMPDGGEVRVETANIPHAEDGGLGVMLIVQDAGQGMDEATRARMYEPCFTTRGSALGTGLGLAVVKEVVEQSGASIACESEPGLGTTFRVVFPLAAGEPEPHARDLPAPQGGVETILLVEDDKSVRGLAARFLGGAGYRVLEARDAVQALALLRHEPGPKVDLLLTDVVLPGVDGRVLALRAAELVPGLKVLYTSGLADGDMPPPTVEDDPGHFVPKPYTMHELLGRVRALLDRDAPPATPRPATVLVVDDDPDIVRVAHAFLAEAGYRVLTARDGAEALAVLETAACDTVLCDIFMPNKEGIETCRELRRLYPSLPVIAMSGALGGASYLRVAERLGAVAGLDKPFDSLQLVSAVRRAVSSGAAPRA
jgi:signal transduction histidine kinase/DNA-binding response OmpR family regulator